jgi:hypothetical protein
MEVGKPASSQTRKKTSNLSEGTALPTIVEIAFLQREESKR